MTHHNILRGADVDISFYFSLFFLDAIREKRITRHL